MSVSYLSVIPENNKSSYSEHDTVDFVLTFENQALKLGSLRLEGEFEVKQNNLFLNNLANQNKVIKYDNFTGLHSIVDSIQTEMLGEVYESINEYPRMVKQNAVAQNSTGDLFNSSKSCELRTPYDFMTTQYMKGIEPKVQVAPAVRINPDFSIKLDCLLNSSISTLNYDRSGPIRLSINLSRVNSVLYGADVDGNTTYSVKDLRLVCRTTNDLSNTSPIQLRRKINIKQSISSSLSNIQTKVPADNVESFSASLQLQTHENTTFYNNLDLQPLPNLEQLQFLYNDQSNSQVSYLIRSDSEVISKFIESIGDNGRNNMSPNNMINNRGYGIGLKMGGVNLSNQKFSLQINSSISNNNPMVLYMYFNTVLTV